MKTNAPVPAQPDEPFYSSDKLNLFPTYTRATYAEAFGDPPDFDGDKHAKMWFDPNLEGAAPDAIVEYPTIEMTPSGPVVGKISMPVREARSVNMPGLHTYPAYVIKKTLATRHGQPLRENQLSLREEAVMIAKMLGLGANAIVEQDVGAIQYPADEPRRELAIQWKPPNNPIADVQELTVGVLLFEMYSVNGVGCPGHWDQTAAEPNWLSDKPSMTALPKTSWPNPKRDLLPNEKLVPALMGFVVARTDKDSVYVTPTPTSTGAGLTAEQSQKLDVIHNWVKKRIAVESL